MKTGKNLTATKFHRAGAIAGCVTLNAHDIGRALVSGKSVWFAWGDNLNADSAEKLRAEGFDTVKCGQFFSTVIPASCMANLFPAIIWSYSRDSAILARQIKAQA